eukprot:scaffold84315_cov34-Prasinocladus_malaysianus.AAC.1
MQHLSVRKLRCRKNDTDSGKLRNDHKICSSALLCTQSPHFNDKDCTVLRDQEARWSPHGY